jgi:acetolactate synthase-1/2/3 large subunit
MMNVQELVTAVHYKMPIKIFLMNNSFLGMVRQWQELFWDKRYSNTSFAEFQPDFSALAGAYGIPGTRVEDPDDLEDALRETLSTDGPALIDVQVNRDAKVFPMVPQGKGPDAILVKDPTK